MSVGRPSDATLPNIQRVPGLDPAFSLATRRLHRRRHFPQTVPVPSFFASPEAGTVGAYSAALQQVPQCSSMDEMNRVESAMEVYSKWGAKALRSECRGLRATPTTQNKASYLAALRASQIVSGTIEITGVVQDPFLQENCERKAVACVFRLLNVLFSDIFCAGVATLGDVATRQALDTHTLGSASPWWNEVTTAYNDEDNESFNALLHIQPEISTLDLAPFKNHDSQKLWAIWKELTRDYRGVDGRFTTSCNQAPFTAFYGGQMDIYYLHLPTTVTRPNLHSCIIPTLPKDVMADSLGVTSARNPPKSTPGKNGSRTDGMIDVLKEFAYNEDRTVLTSVRERAAAGVRIRITATYHGATGGNVAYESGQLDGRASKRTSWPAPEKRSTSPIRRTADNKREKLKLPEERGQSLQPRNGEGQLMITASGL
ncbi:unnamed protein product [Phytophthora fragariaefolia]|uniref:Unnamed protein product n=1 Tax=Phytophthora fragariaefolia TaxID=1490495 RepID=A0A9W6XU76_9STRA|nr:unnamed protein product [Phytophthora fragariaefolia]